MAATPPPPVPVRPEAAYGPLELLLIGVDAMIKDHLEKMSNEVNQEIILPAVMGPADEVVTNEWSPMVIATVDANLGKMVEDVWTELPQMVSDSIDRALGEAGRTVLHQLARNEYTCALPCNCEPGCPGVIQQNNDDVWCGSNN